MYPLIVRFFIVLLLGLFSKSVLAECSLHDVVKKGSSFDQWSVRYQSEMDKLVPESDRWNEVNDVFTRAAELVMPVEQLAADGQYDAACAQYSKLESELDITLSSAAIGSVKNEEVQAQVAEKDLTHCHAGKVSNLIVNEGENVVLNGNIELGGNVEIRGNVEFKGTVVADRSCIDLVEAVPPSCDWTEAWTSFIGVRDNLEAKSSVGDFTPEQVTIYSSELAPIQSMISVDPAQVCLDLVPFREKWGV